MRQPRRTGPGGLVRLPVTALCDNRYQCRQRSVDSPRTSESDAYVLDISALPNSKPVAGGSARNLGGARSAFGDQFLGAPDSTAVGIEETSLRVRVGAVVGGEWGVAVRSAIWRAAATPPGPFSAKLSTFVYCSFKRDFAQIGIRQGTL